jgi:hypothetical protein
MQEMGNFVGERRQFVATIVKKSCEAFFPDSKPQRNNDKTAADMALTKAVENIYQRVRMNTSPDDDDLRPV